MHDSELRMILLGINLRILSLKTLRVKGKLSEAALNAGLSDLENKMALALEMVPR